MIGFQGPLMAAVLSAFLGSFVPFYDLELDSWILEAVMNFLQSLTARAAMPAKEKKSLTAKAAMPAKEEKSLTAKGAVDAKGTTIGSTPGEEREDNAKYGMAASATAPAYVGTPVNLVEYHPAPPLPPLALSWRTRS